MSLRSSEPATSIFFARGDGKGKRKRMKEEVLRFRILLLLLLHDGLDAPEGEQVLCRSGQLRKDSSPLQRTTASW